MNALRRSCAVGLVSLVIVCGVAFAGPASAATTTPGPTPTPTHSVVATGGNRVAGFALAVVILVGIGYAARTVRRRRVDRD